MPTFQTILEVVCRARNVSAEDINSPKRDRATASVRFEIIWLAREMTHLSWSNLSAFVGYRDQTSLNFATRRVNQRMNTNPRYAAEIKYLQEMILSVESGFKELVVSDPSHKRTCELARTIRDNHGDIEISKTDAQDLSRALLNAIGEPAFPRSGATHRGSNQ